MLANQRSRETSSAWGTLRACKVSSGGSGGGNGTHGGQGGTSFVGGASAVSKGRDPTRRAGPGSELRCLRW